MALKINNATAVYAIMLVLFAAGMWAILAYGSTLRPQPDFAGEWEFVREGAGSSGVSSVERVSIEQSGRFLHVRFRSARDVIPLKIIAWRGQLDDTAQKPPVVLKDPAGRQATFLQLPGSESSYRIMLPDGIAYRAQCVSHAHPRAIAAVNAPSTAPAATQPHAP